MHHYLYKFCPFYFGSKYSLSVISIIIVIISGRCSIMRGQNQFWIISISLIQLDFRVLRLLLEYLLDLITSQTRIDEYYNIFFSYVQRMCSMCTFNPISEWCCRVSKLWQKKGKSIYVKINQALRGHRLRLFFCCIHVKWNHEKNAHREMK
jgi:hypothetical protein